MAILGRLLFALAGQGKPEAQGSEQLQEEKLRISPNAFSAALMPLGWSL